MEELPRNEAASLSLEAALYDSKAGRFNPTVSQPTQTSPQPSASKPAQSMPAPRQS